MSTTKQQISEWFDEGKEDGATHMLVVCDTFDWEDYPVYATSDDEVRREFRRRDELNMQRVMEVYDLRLPKDPQLAEHRAFHLPSDSDK